MVKSVYLAAAALAASCVAANSEADYLSEVWTPEQEAAAGIVSNNYKVGTAPHEYMKTSDLPAEHNWCDLNGKNFCTRVRNWLT